MPAPNHSVFTGRMPFLPPKQQRQSTEGTLSLHYLTKHRNMKIAPFKRCVNGLKQFDLSLLHFFNIPDLQVATNIHTNV